ncbi:MAG TPA: hypothetical protein VK778_14185 [Solirubrobacteraceae bacterium]|jgi:hypothetical protein|nr:hypothetical protein [Solirubrobacteraceae bacterium]
MRSLQIQAALSEFVEAAASHLHAALLAGAEVPFELEPQTVRRRSSASRTGESTFYAYRALTGEFIAERWPELRCLPSHAHAASSLESFDGLDRYLANVSASSSPEGEPARGDARARVRAALLALLEEVFEDQTDFELRPERLSAALERLERSALAGGGETMLVATLHGLTIGSRELPLTRGLTIAQPDALEGIPEGALATAADGSHDHLIVALAAGQDDPREAIPRGRAVLQDLLRALRLFGDGRVTLGALAWARVGDGRWRSLALGAGGRPHGMLVVTVEQEDELRAFCSLVSRRAPDGNELAWALRRFELGCERDSAFEALSDHLLALRALLEPEGPTSGLLPGRLAALCATPERWLELTERTVQALALERDVVSGACAAHGERSHAGQQQQLAREMADHLRALLRDVICGHLDPDLVALADQLLAGAHEPAAHEPRAPDAAVSSIEEVLGDAAQAEEILDVFI